jgi:hypothetical protein
MTLADDYVPRFERQVTMTTAALVRKFARARVLEDQPGFCPLWRPESAYSLCLTTGLS